MRNFGSLVLALAMGVAPIAIAQNFGTATNPAPDPAAAQKSRVLTQQGRAVDESTAASPGTGPSSAAARAQKEVRDGNDATRKAAEAKGSLPDNTSAPSDQARVSAESNGDARTDSEPRESSWHHASGRFGGRPRERRDPPFAKPHCADRTPPRATATPLRPGRASHWVRVKPRRCRRIEAKGRTAGELVTGGGRSAAHSLQSAGLSACGTSIARIAARYLV